MNFVILKKAKPYTRVRRGKLERVAGYASRPGTILPEAKVEKLFGPGWSEISPPTRALMNKDYKMDAGVSEGYTIGQHTEMVIRQFEKYFADKSLPLLSPKTFRRLLSLHDLGKASAIRIYGDKSMQSKFNVQIIDKVFSKVGEDEQSIKVAKALVGQDLIGSYLKDVTTEPETVATKFEDIAKDIGVDTKEFYELAKIYFMMDAGSYTADAGGVASLDYLFDFKPGKMYFSPWAKPRIDLLDTAVSGRLNA
jgi:hypothetical protein